MKNNHNKWESHQLSSYVLLLQSLAVWSENEENLTHGFLKLFQPHTIISVTKTTINLTETKEKNNPTKQKNRPSKQSKNINQASKTKQNKIQKQKPTNKHKAKPKRRRTTLF